MRKERKEFASTRVKKCTKTMDSETEADTWLRYFLKKSNFSAPFFSGKSAPCWHSQCCELFVGGLEISGAYFSRSIPRKSGCVAKLTSVCCGGIWPLSPDQRDRSNGVLSVLLLLLYPWGQILTWIRAVEVDNEGNRHSPTCKGPLQVGENEASSLWAN